MRRQPLSTAGCEPRVNVCACARIKAPCESQPHAVQTRRVCTAWLVGSDGMGAVALVVELLSPIELVSYHTD